MTHEFVIVGAGFAGSVCARELAKAGHSVPIMERGPHIEGNDHDCHDEHGVLIHRYEPHIFHTNSERVIE